MVSATLPTSTFSGSMRRYGRPQRWARYSVSISASSGLPSLARAMATLASRTSGGCELSACEQRAMVRCASSSAMTPSVRSHSTMRRQSSGPVWTEAGASFADVAAWWCVMTEVQKNVTEPSGRERLESAHPFGGGDSPALLDVGAARSQLAALEPAGRALRQHHGVALARGLEGPERILAKNARELLHALRKAGAPAEQVHRHAAALAQQCAAVGVELGAVENGGRCVVVVQIDTEPIPRAQPHRVADLLRRIGQHHPQLGAVGRQLEPRAAHGQHLRVQLDGGGAHAQLLVAELGDGARAQAQLHGVALAYGIGLH